MRELSDMLLISSSHQSQKFVWDIKTLCGTSTKRRCHILDAHWTVSKRNRFTELQPLTGPQKQRNFPLVLQPKSCTVGLMYTFLRRARYNPEINVQCVYFGSILKLACTVPLALHLCVCVLQMNYLYPGADFEGVGPRNRSETRSPQKQFWRSVVLRIASF